MQFGSIDTPLSRLIYGCMRLNGDNSSDAIKQGQKAIQAAIDCGYTHFDHADIYGGGACEKIFGDYISASNIERESLFITSKAGIRGADTPNKGDPTRYDFSKNYLIEKVEQSLSSLKTDYLDMFLLHRPDYLMDIHEVAEAFALLKASGKVKYFGVSNFSVSQVSLLQSALAMPLHTNQIEINIHNISAFSDGVLDQCQQAKMSPVAWCPLGGVVYPAWGNTFSTEDEVRISAELSVQSSKYEVEPWVVALAWLLKHPSNIFPIIGSTNPERIAMAKKALSLDYTREDWYQLLEARNGQSVP